MPCRSCQSQTVAVTDGLLFPQTLLRRLAMEVDDAAAPQTLLKCLGQSPEDYCVKVLKKVLCLCSLVAGGVHMYGMSTWSSCFRGWRCCSRTLARAALSWTPIKGKAVVETCYASIVWGTNVMKLIKNIFFNQRDILGFLKI